jgi:hypothetical protein
MTTTTTMIKQVDDNIVPTDPRPRRRNVIFTQIQRHQRMRDTHLDNRREFHRKPKSFIFHIIVSVQRLPQSTSIYLTLKSIYLIYLKVR